MKPDRDFERQLQNLYLEANEVASYVYAEMAVKHAASKSKRLLARLNMTPTFWKTCFAAFQSSAYVALGRVFDLKSPYNLEAMLASMEVNIHIFSQKSLATRKHADGFSDPRRLAAYISKAHVLTPTDIRRIRRSVQLRRAVYERAIMPVRHQYLAHRQAHGKEEVDRLYQKGKVKEMLQLATYLHHLHQELWNLFHNGHKPNLRFRSRYSPKVMYDRPANISGPHERMVQDARKLMWLLEEATPNN